VITDVTDDLCVDGVGATSLVGGVEVNDGWDELQAPSDAVTKAAAANKTWALRMPRPCHRDIRKACMGGKETMSSCRGY
jgi:hypothetical protein